jgi:hypothetical protein
LKRKIKIFLTIPALLAWVCVPFINDLLLDFYGLKDNDSAEASIHFRTNLVPTRNIIYNGILTMSIGLIAWGIFDRVNGKKLSQFEIIATIFLTVFTVHFWF